MTTPLLQSDEEYRLALEDCIPHMTEAMPPMSVDFAVFSPPFPSLYAYTSKSEDLGNSENLAGEGKLHFSFFYHALRRVVKPGRVVIVHVAQIPRMKRSGEQGLHDFRGLNIRLGERAGLVYESDIPITKNPQSQAIRTKSRELQFTGLESDRAKIRPALNDYLIKFRAPGENAIPIDNPGEVTRNEWILWAEGVWSWQQIRETDTLNVREGRGEEDTKHICPLQLGAIERLIRLYSLPDEIVFSPFAGIGSEGYQALLYGRRFYGCEIKAEYHAAAIRNLERAIVQREREKQELLPGFAMTA